jgi:4,5-DOPA dioxygenase extradiol
MPSAKPGFKPTRESMPILFVGHGNPMNAIEDNPFSREWTRIGRELPKPKAILCISAHWETWGVMVTAMDEPRTIHDFGGFPPELYAVQYPAPGSKWLAQEVCSTVKQVNIALDQDWGLDHGCWSVISRMFPKAEIPVVQLSLDASQPASFHFDLAKELAPLREKGVLIIGSGNMVHNLRRVVIPSGNFDDFNKPYGLSWAISANEKFKKLIISGKFQELVDYPSLGADVQLAIPTPEHYLPMLYMLALKRKEDEFTWFNDVPLAGSLTMTSFVLNPMNS